MTRPRLGFAGAGWIGRSRLEALAASGVAEITAIADPDPDRRRAAARLAPQAALAADADALLELELDGVVIATPSALHAQQSVTALERGLAVFCQKPLARTAGETAAVVRAAQATGCLLGVDFSYRHTAAMTRIEQLVSGGELGEVYAAELVFHNAYGPDAPWFYDRRLAGGGCVMDLGIHLIDLALWTLGFPEVTGVTSRLYCGGERRERCDAARVEDYAVVRVDLATGAVLQLSCSWRLPAGRDAVIEARFYGTSGGAGLRNIDGSFYDFVAELWRGTRTTALTGPPDDWGGRAAVAWATRLAAGEGFAPACETLIQVAEVMDAIYGR